MSQGGWIGVDLDGTLAYYDEWRGIEHIGAPIPAMVERVKDWLAAGIEVKIFTARVAPADPMTEAKFIELQRTLTVILAWSKAQFGVELDVTCMKDYGMIQLWDDRCVQVQTNTGVALQDLLLEKA
jgi:hypothetical protein